MNCWQTPSEGSKAAFYGYRDLFSKFLVDGALQQEMLHPWEWEQISFLLEDADFYLQYVEMAARIKAKEILAFIGMLKKTKRLYVFGSGFYGKAVAVFLLSNQIDSFVGFVDNDPNKQEKEIYHKQVLAVNDAVKKGTDSFFVLPPGRHKDAMRDQLLRLGVPKENVLEYTLDTSPIFCTNYMIMKRSEGGNKL